MSSKKLYRLQDLIDEIERLEKLIKVHSENSSSFMREQYESKKDTLLGRLIDELVKNPSVYSFKIIVLALKKFYPHIETVKEIEEYNVLESVLS